MSKAKGSVAKLVAQAKRQSDAEEGTLLYPPFYRLGWTTAHVYWCPKCRARAHVERIDGDVHLVCDMFGCQTKVTQTNA